MIKKIFVITLFLVWTSIVFVSGVKVGIDGTEKRLVSQPLTKPNYNGQEIFDAVNSYRQSERLSILKIDEGLCNSVVDRYLSFKSTEADTNAHPGFDPWADEKLKSGYKYVAEVFSGEFTKDEVIKGWQGSPSHNKALINPIYNLGCSYAGDYGVVVLMGVK